MSTITSERLPEYVLAPSSYQQDALQQKKNRIPKEPIYIDTMRRINGSEYTNIFLTLRDEFMGQFGQIDENRRAVPRVFIQVHWEGNRKIHEVDDLFFMDTMNLLKAHRNDPWLTFTPEADTWLQLDRPTETLPNCHLATLDYPFNDQNGWILYAGKMIQDYSGRTLIAADHVGTQPFYQENYMYGVGLFAPHSLIHDPRIRTFGDPPIEHNVYVSHHKGHGVVMTEQVF